MKTLDLGPWIVKPAPVDGAAFLGDDDLHHEIKHGAAASQPVKAALRPMPIFDQRTGWQHFEWDESLHPRDDKGRFGPGGGDSSTKSNSGEAGTSGSALTPQTISSMPHPSSDFTKEQWAQRAAAVEAATSPPVPTTEDQYDKLPGGAWTAERSGSA